jgi:serine protease inhibitor
VTLHLAQRLWGARGFGADFLVRLADGYGAPLGVIDFADPERARLAINHWAARAMNDLIRDLLHPGDITPQTRLVLTNAVHFASRWRSRFDERATRKERFATAQGTVPAAMMHQLGRFAYARLPTFAMLELPCLGDFSVIILLPDSMQGLAALETQLGEHYEKGLSRLAEEPIDVQLPRWKTASSLHLNSALQAMGMLLAFGSGDFSPMSATGAFHIDLVIQQASVEANEQGAEAAAATAVIMTGYGFIRRPSRSEQTVPSFISFAIKRRASFSSRGASAIRADFVPESGVERPCRRRLGSVRRAPSPEGDYTVRFAGGVAVCPSHERQVPLIKSKSIRNIPRATRTRGRS